MKYPRTMMLAAVVTLSVAALMHGASVPPKTVGTSADIPVSKVPTGMTMTAVTGAGGRALIQMRVTVPSSAGTLLLQPGNVLLGGVSTPQYTLTAADKTALGALATPPTGKQDVYIELATLPGNPTLEVGIGPYGHKLLAFGGPVLASMAVLPQPLVANGSSSYDPQTVVRLRVDVPAGDGLSSLTIQSATAKINGVAATPYTPTTAEKNAFASPTPGLNQQDLYFKRVAMPALVAGMTIMELTANLGPNGIAMVATGTVTVN